MVKMWLGTGDFMTTNPNRTFVSLRVRGVLCLLLFVAAGIAVLTPTRTAPARPTPTPRPRPTPCEVLPEVFDVTVGQGLAFVPNTLNITANDIVRWTWVSSGHSVTSGINCTANGLFCSPGNVNCSQGILSNSGTVYELTFSQPGTYYYFCAAHCAMGMTGVINVAPRPRRPCAD
jgi:plastocyanin